jgi:hypothetical protein
MNDATDALKPSSSEPSHRGNGIEPAVAQHSVEDDVNNDSDTSTSSGETLKAKQSPFEQGFFYEFTQSSRKIPCTPQLLRWAHESHRSNLTLAAILVKANWEAARLEKL